jgi:hypothetical protein
MYAVKDMAWIYGLEIIPNNTLVQLLMSDVLMLSVCW